MASKLPSMGGGGLGSRLPKPASLRTPIHGMKRRNSVQSGSPEKKQRLSDGTTSTGFQTNDMKKMPCPAKRAPVAKVKPNTHSLTVQVPGKLRRSISMASIAVPGRSASLRPGQLASKIGMGLTKSKTGSSSNLLSSTRSSNMNTSTLQRTKLKPSGPASARLPGTNITNRVNNIPVTASKTSTGSKQSVGESSKSEPAPSKGKGRPAWDLKGRLQDMENLMKMNVRQMADTDQRIASLETEKMELHENLKETKTYSKSATEEIETLKETQRKEREKCSEERRDLESKNRDYEFKISSMEHQVSAQGRQITSLESELNAKIQEISGLKTSVAKLVSSREGLEADLSGKKVLLEDWTKKGLHFQSLSEEQSKTIQELKDKVINGETERRHLHNSILELKGNIRVFCRVRPLIGEELSKNGSDHIHHMNFTDEKSVELVKSGTLSLATNSVFDLDGSSMSGLKNRSSNLEFTFDHVFTPTDSQEIVFQEIAQLSQSALDGYNVCVFAYGQTGSGKTFTMEGIYGDSNKEGMIPRTVRHIFCSIEDLQDKGWQYTVEVSILEIYNENIRDLLATAKDAKNLTYEIKMVDSKKSDIYVTNLKVERVENASQVRNLLNTAQQHRAVAATNMNERSSRSHSVFQLNIKGTNVKTESSCEGTLSLVDLAGSERLKDSKSEGARLIEAQNINKSLANLGNVIMALGQKQSHIPYRNSKLTQLLQNSLGGNSKTLMFVNVSPNDACFNESLNSLRFATKVNQCHIGTAVKQIKK